MFTGRQIGKFNLIKFIKQGKVQEEGEGTGRKITLMKTSPYVADNPKPHAALRQMPTEQPLNLPGALLEGRASGEAL